MKVQTFYLKKQIPLCFDDDADPLNADRRGSFWGQLELGCQGVPHSESGMIINLNHFEDLVAGLKGSFQSGEVWRFKSVFQAFEDIRREFFSRWRDLKKQIEKSPEDLNCELRQISFLRTAETWRKVLWSQGEVYRKDKIWIEVPSGTEVPLWREAFETFIWKKETWVPFQTSTEIHPNLLMSTKISRHRRRDFESRRRFFLI